MSSKASRWWALIPIIVVIVGLLAAALMPSVACSRDKAAAPACKMILTRIQAVKQAWAFENQKREEAIPTPLDLFGADRWMDQPACPKGGTYTLNAVNQKPTCSVHDHQVE